MAANQNRYRVGEVRPSQILFSSGPASVVDLPNMSVMIMGIDDWDLAASATVTENRLLAQVQKELGAQVTQLRLPPVAPDGNDTNPFDESWRIGVPVAPFPGWMLCPQCRLIAPISSGLFMLKTDLYRPDKTRYVHANCPKYSKPVIVIPVRFLVACTHGHMDDFPWSYFLHGPGSGCNGPIRLIEYGLSGTAADIELRCDGCSATQRMSEAFGDRGKKRMPKCRGRHPHLRSFDEEGCSEQMEGILLGASNSWFPISLAALSIPSVASKTAQAVERNLSILEGATSLDLLRGILTAFKNSGLFADLTAHEPEELWAEIEKQRAGAADKPDEKLKPPEWRAFSQPSASTSSPDFRLVPVEPPRDYERFFEKTVLVEQVREVRALLGFTRIESPYDFAEGEELRDDARGPLCRSKLPKWVPVSETRGEGIFLQFGEAAIADWLERVPEIETYESATLEAHKAWRKARNIPEPGKHFPGARYLLLHTFAHALMRQLAIECGYSAASLSERIYSAGPTEEDGPMAGVLIYTSAPDSEGTLGGLVSLGHPATLGRHIDQALDAIALCASDPLCAEHDPRAGTASLHWAACHACLFAPETSCERGNRYLDRGLLAATVKSNALAFFRPGD